MLHGHHAQEGIMKKNSLTKLLALTLCAVLALSLFEKGFLYFIFRRIGNSQSEKMTFDTR